MGELEGDGRYCHRSWIPLVSRLFPEANKGYFDTEQSASSTHFLLGLIQGY